MANIRRVDPFPANLDDFFRLLVERLVADATIPPNASLSRVRNVLAGGGIIMSEGEILHPQERTSFVIELDQMIERHAPAKKTARRAATKARTAAVTKPQDDAGPMDDNLLAGGSALYGSGDEPGRSNSSEESVEGPLRDCRTMQAQQIAGGRRQLP